MEPDDSPKNKGGRPTKFNETIRDKIMAMAGAGKTDVEISKAVGVSRSTFSLWKNAHKISDTLKDAKNIADELVEASLFRRAIGYEHKEVKVFYDSKSGECVEHEVVKHYAPDPTSMIFWLKNRKPQEWRDKVDIAVEDIDEMEFD